MNISSWNARSYTMKNILLFIVSAMLAGHILLLAMSTMLPSHAAVTAIGDFMGRSHLRRGNFQLGTCDADAECQDGKYCMFRHCWNGDEGNPCLNSSQCKSENSQQQPIVCRFGGSNRNFKKCLEQSKKGELCFYDEDCLGRGYCYRERCWDGSEGDVCRDPADCQVGLVCESISLLWKECLIPTVSPKTFRDDSLARNDAAEVQRI